MTPFDLILTPIYVILVLSCGLMVRSYHKEELVYRRYFMPGLLVKLFGGLSFALVYEYYYTYGGDTKTYFHDASIMAELFLSSPVEYFKMILGGTERLFIDHYEVVSSLKYTIGTSEWFTVKLSSILAVLGFNTYLTTTIIFSMFSYVGIWKLYTVLVRRYPDIHKGLALAILFIPSVFFWGSGIMKDSVVLGFLGLLIYYVDRFTLVHGMRKLFYVGLIFISAYIIYQVKAYVVISLVPALILWIVLEQREKIRSRVLRTIVFPFFLIVSLLCIGFSVSVLGRYNEKYAVENVLSTAQGMQNWHYVEGENSSDRHGRGSSYSLGDYEPSLIGSMKMFLPAVNVTLFRPYIWEIRNVAMAAAALESLLVLFLTIYVLFRTGIRRLAKLLMGDSFLFMAMSFSLFFAFAIGFTSYNFGALVRYKIPCIPFFISGLFILQYKVAVIKKAKRIGRPRLF